MVVSEQLIRAVVDNTCLLAKLDMVGRLDKRIEEHERKEQKREERRESLEQKLNEEWRNAFFRLR